MSLSRAECDIGPLRSNGRNRNYKSLIRNRKSAGRNRLRKSGAHAQSGALIIGITKTGPRLAIFLFKAICGHSLCWTRLIASMEWRLRRQIARALARQPPATLRPDTDAPTSSTHLVRVQLRLTRVPTPTHLSTSTTEPARACQHAPRLCWHSHSARATPFTALPAPVTCFTAL